MEQPQALRQSRTQEDGMCLVYKLRLTSVSVQYWGYSGSMHARYMIDMAVDATALPHVCLDTCKYKSCPCRGKSLGLTNFVPAAASNC